MTDPSPDSRSSLVLYQTEDGRTAIQCRLEGDTLWLTQALMAELFQVSVPTINEHLKTLFEEREVDPTATIRSIRIVRTEGARQVAREIEHCSLPAILAVGYRVRSPRRTEFRHWAKRRAPRLHVQRFSLDAGPRAFTDSSATPAGRLSA